MTNCVSKSKFKEEVFSYVFLILGSALFAVGDVMFVNPYLMAPGGTYGISNVLNTVWPWKISLYAICMDVPLLLIGTWILGPKFGFKTILSTALIFGFTFVLESVWGYNPVIFDGKIMDTPIEGLSMVQIPHDGGWFTPDYFLNTVVAGLIYGVAIGLIFRSGATSGGSDIISMILHKYTKISLGTLVMIVDGCITLSTLVAFGDIRLPIYSIIIIVIEGKVIDLVVDGMKVMLVIMAMDIIGIKATSFIAVLGAAGLAVGMALQGTLQNFAGGVIILLMRPFKVGDYIEANGYKGYVKDIRIFHTFIRPFNGRIIIVPNSELATKSLINHTKEPVIRLDVTASVAYGTDLDKAMAVLKKVVDDDELILKDPIPKICVSELNTSSVDYSMWLWTTVDDYWTVWMRIRENIYKAFNENGISIPFPQLDVHFDPTNKVAQS